MKQLQTSSPLRILIGKAGLDGHDRGAKVIARALRDAGIEVIYSGLHNTTEMLVKAAIEEDVDAIGISILSGAHMTIFPAIVEGLIKENAQDITVFGGGIIPDSDRIELEKIGVSKLFSPGSSIEEIVKWIKIGVKNRRSVHG